MSPASRAELRGLARLLTGAAPAACVAVRCARCGLRAAPAWRPLVRPMPARARGGGEEAPVTRARSLHASASRVIGYTIEAPHGFDEAKVERLLRVAERAGIVARGQWDTGRGRLVWFNGPPGPRMRAIRDQIAAELR